MTMCADFTSPPPLHLGQGQRDYAALLAGTRSWSGNDNLGHGVGRQILVYAGYFGIAGAR